jgi:hypothetical protein
MVVHGFYSPSAMTMIFHVKDAGDVENLDLSFVAKALKFFLKL